MKKLFCSKQFFFENQVTHCPGLELYHEATETFMPDLKLDVPEISTFVGPVQAWEYRIAIAQYAGNQGSIH